MSIRYREPFTPLALPTTPRTAWSGRGAGGGFLETLVQPLVHARTACFCISMDNS